MLRHTAHQDVRCIRCILFYINFASITDALTVRELQCVAVRALQATCALAYSDDSASVREASLRLLYAALPSLSPAFTSTDVDQPHQVSTILTLFITMCVSADTSLMTTV
jgi:hypothetical protein